MIHKETLGFECGYREVNVGLVGRIMGGLMFLIKKIIPLLGIQGTMTHKKTSLHKKSSLPPLSKCQDYMSVTYY